MAGLESGSGRVGLESGSGRVGGRVRVGSGRG